MLDAPVSIHPIRKKRRNILSAMITINLIKVPNFHKLLAGALLWLCSVWFCSALMYNEAGRHKIIILVNSYLLVVVNSIALSEWKHSFSCGKQKKMRMKTKKKYTILGCLVYGNGKEHTYSLLVIILFFTSS